MYESYVIFSLDGVYIYICIYIYVDGPYGVLTGTVIK